VNQYNSLAFGGGVYPIDSRGLAEWIVRKPGGGSITLTASSAKAGTVVREVKLA
jgi:hypothetical protein